MQKYNTFQDTGLCPTLITQIVKLGYENPTPIQVEAIPKILNNLNVVGKSHTGSGKTAAFALPLIQKCLENPKVGKVLILSPTRELSLQIETACNAFAPSVRTTCLYGGVGYPNQVRNLREANVVVGTAGRTMDLIKSKNLDLSLVEHFVLDEADSLLSMGFIEDIKWIKSQISSEAQVILFSATIDSDISQLINKLVRDPQIISIKSEGRTADTIEQFYITTPGDSARKLQALEYILEIYNPDSALIFVPTKITTGLVGDYLRAKGSRIGVLHGDIDQKQRERIVNLFRLKKLDVLVATDVIARGLDIDHVTHVINYGLPKDADSYVHRIGRTGRVGRSGTSITFVTSREVKALMRIERLTRKTIKKIEMPTQKDIYNSRISNYIKQIKEASQKVELNKFDDIYDRLAADIDEQALAKTLIYLVQRKKPLKVEPIDVRSPSYSRNEDRYDRTRRSSIGRSEFGHRGQSRNTGRDQGTYSNRGRDQGTYSYSIPLGAVQGITPADVFTSLLRNLNVDKKDIGRIKILPNTTVFYTNVRLISDSSLNIQGQYLPVSEARGQR